MPAPVESGGFGSVGDIPQRHPHSPPSTKEVRMLTEMGTTRGVHDSPIRDRDLDDSDAWSDDSHHTVPFTPDRGAPPSYEETMSSPMPTGPPRSPPRLGNHQSSYSGEGTRTQLLRVFTFFPACYIVFSNGARASRVAHPTQFSPSSQSNPPPHLSNPHTNHRRRRVRLTRISRPRLALPEVREPRLLETPYFELFSCCLPRPRNEFWSENTVRKFGSRGEHGLPLPPPHQPILTHSPPRYEEIRITFPAKRTRQLTALEAYKVRGAPCRRDALETKKHINQQHPFQNPRLTFFFSPHRLLPLSPAPPTARPA